MIDIHQAIYVLNPSVVTIRGDVAYDQNEKIVQYDLAQAQSKLSELQTAETVAKQAAIDTKASALAKLAALGLTQDEVKTLVGTR
jgi:hypothetical protein